MTKYPNSTLNNGWKKDNLCKHKCSSVGISDDTYKKKLERAIEGITLFTFANPDVNRNKKCSDFGKKNYSGNGNSLCSNFGNNSAVTVVLN